MKKRKALLAVTAITVAAVSLFTGCSGVSAATDDWMRTVTNIDGSEIRLLDDPQQIAAIYGPSYEALVVLGAEDKIVINADVQYENFPWAVKIFSRIEEVPHLVNVHSSVSIEELLKAKPDIAFTFARPNELRQMEQSGIAAVPGTTSEKLDDVKDFLMVYAEALGEYYIPAAEKYAAYFDDKREMVHAVTKDIPMADRPGVYYAGIDILTTYGRYSDIIELIEVAGGRAVSSELEAGNRTQINFEQLASWNPDVIFIDHGGMNDKQIVEEVLAATYRNKRYATIQAVADEEVYLSPSGVFYWDMGLQKILLLLYMAKTLHPGLFEDLDMAAEVQAFYLEFYGYKLSREEAEQILTREDPS